MLALQHLSQVLRLKLVILLCNLFASSAKEVGLVLSRITESPFDSHCSLFWMATVKKILMG